MDRELTDSTVSMQRMERFEKNIDQKKRLRQKANQGDPRAQYLMGLMAIRGSETKNYPEALVWFSLSAVQSQPDAQYNLAVLYERGLGAEKNKSKALLWYHAAAENNYPQAQFNLGCFFLWGIGTSQNFDEAVRWHKRASEQGITEAKQNLIRLAKMDGESTISHKRLQKFHHTLDLTKK